MTNIHRTYPYIGVVSVDGVLKVSFRSSKEKKIKMMPRDARVDFVDLPHPMTKVDALNWAIAHNVFSATDLPVLEETLLYQNKLVERASGVVRPRGRPRKSGSVTVGRAPSRRNSTTVRDVLRVLDLTTV